MSTAADIHEYVLPAPTILSLVQRYCGSKFDNSACHNLDPLEQEDKLIRTDLSMWQCTCTGDLCNSSTRWHNSYAVTAIGESRASAHEIMSSISEALGWLDVFSALILVTGSWWTKRHSLNIAKNLDHLTSGYRQSCSYCYVIFEFNSPSETWSINYGPSNKPSI